jgi:hypothetical protein
MDPATVVISDSHRLGDVASVHSCNTFRDLSAGPWLAIPYVETIFLVAEFPL